MVKDERNAKMTFRHVEMSVTKSCRAAIVVMMSVTQRDVRRVKKAYLYRADVAESIRVLSRVAIRVGVMIVLRVSPLMNLPATVGERGWEASASTPSVSGTCEFDEKLLRYAKDHPSWAQTIEKNLASFVQDQSKRVHHFPQMKPAANVAAAALAAYYGLIGEVVDAERGQGSVLIRKTAAKTPALPAQLLSAAASSYKPAPSVLPILQVERGNASSLAVQTGSDGPVNALCITSLQFGMDARDVQLLLEPLVGSDLNVNVRLVDHDAVAVFTGVRHGEDDIAAILVAIQPDVKSKFLDNNWAKDVKCCSAVVDTSAKSKPKTVTPIAAPRAVHLPWRREVPVANGFGVLETEQASPPNPTTPSPVLSLGRPKTPDAWDDVDE
ncbi:hypothetical protein HDU85_006184 [Gaertneriomyces sp. JEL0708]|nr:hypothetical protein HDU85_006184 [Gaertneriomyces sp. JEL0708]